MSTLKEKVKLTPFQRNWVADGARFKIAVKARRIGFTFATTLEIARDCVRRSTRWLVISRTQDTAKEAVREISNHFKAMQIVERVEDSGLRLDEIKINKFVIELPNGSEITAMTAHPDAARGFGGNVFLDEFGFHRDSYELWKGAAASVMRGHRLVVVSTPHYQIGKYYDLARDCEMTSGHPVKAASRKGIWSRHWVDITTAAPQLSAIKVPPFWFVDPEIEDDPGYENVAGALEELEELAGDPETWNQEFCCQFLSAAEMWIPLELIAAARSEQASFDWDAEGNYEGALYIGADIGRKRDRTVIWIDERVADVAICRGVIALDRMPFERQYEKFCELIAHPRVRRACMDQTGIGMALVERLQEKFGSKVEGITFTGEAKEDMAIRLRRRMEEKLDKIPANAPEVERDFAMIKRQVTASGNLRFDAVRTENSHADIFWAKALADLAADAGVPAACFGNDDQMKNPSPRFGFNTGFSGGRDDARPSIWDGDRELAKAGMFE